MSKRFRETAAKALSAVGSTLPDASVQGEPFWALMEIRDGRLTGAMWVRESTGQTFLTFFASRESAERARTLLPDAEDWVVRGISKGHLVFLVSVGQRELSFGIALEPVPANGSLEVVRVSAEQLLTAQ